MRSFYHDLHCTCSPFSVSWWSYLVLTGVSLGCAFSSKWVGAFVVLYIGMITVCIKITRLSLFLIVVSLLQLIRFLKWCRRMIYGTFGAISLFLCYSGASISLRGLPVWLCFLWLYTLSSFSCIFRKCLRSWFSGFSNRIHVLCTFCLGAVRVYLSHFHCLFRICYRSGNGDAFMSSAFQTTLEVCFSFLFSF